MFGILETKKIVKKRKIVGRGGKRGKSSGRGRGGQHSRSGSNSEIGVFFEGGQMSYFRRLPRRGFNSMSKELTELVKLEDISEKCNGEEVIGFEQLLQAGLIKGKQKAKIKVLANGGITKKVRLVVNAISCTAREMIEKAGGSVELI